MLPDEMRWDFKAWGGWGSFSECGGGGAVGGECDLREFLQPFCSGWKAVEVDLNGVGEGGDVGGKEACIQKPRAFRL